MERAKVNYSKEKTESNSPLILLVEDNIISLHMLENVAEQAKYQFYSAIDGEHALELLETNDFDLIITDIGISSKADKNLIQCIREQEKQTRKNPIPIIGLTTNTSGKVENELLRSEMNKVLTKPIHLKMLQEVVNGLNLSSPKEDNVS